MSRGHPGIHFLTLPRCPRTNSHDSVIEGWRLRLQRDYQHCRIRIRRRRRIILGAGAQDAQLQIREAEDLRGPVLLLQFIEDREDLSRVEVQVGGNKPNDGRRHGCIRNVRHRENGMTHPSLPLRQQAITNDESRRTFFLTPCKMYAFLNHGIDI